MVFVFAAHTLTYFLFLSLVVSWYCVLTLVQAIANTILYRSFSRWTAMCCCILPTNNIQILWQIVFILLYALCCVWRISNTTTIFHSALFHSHTHVHILYSLIFSIVDFKMLVVLRLAVLHSVFFLLLLLQHVFLLCWWCFRCCYKFLCYFISLQALPYLVRALTLFSLFSLFRVLFRWVFFLSLSLSLKYVHDFFRGSAVFIHSIVVGAGASFCVLLSLSFSLVSVSLSPCVCVHPFMLFHHFIISCVYSFCFCWHLFLSFYVHSCRFILK